MLNIKKMTVFMLVTVLSLFLAGGASVLANVNGADEGPLFIQPLIFICAGAYLLSSIPFGLVIARVFCDIDPRMDGSKNIGSTNVARLCGLKYGVLTLLCDALKGLLPTWFALHLGYPPSFAGLVALCALLGHLFSIFLRFRGGKAVATTVGVFIPLSFPALLVSALICVAVIWRSGYVSLGSLTLAGSLPLTLALFGRFDLLPFALVVMGVIFIKHRANIKRLMSGEEKSFLKKR